LTVSTEISSSSIPPGAGAYITERLADLAAREDVRLLIAIESGSRA